MAVALNDNALVTLQEAQAFMKGITDTDKLTTWINRASDYCEGYCNRPLKEQDFAGLRLPSQRSAMLRPLATPINVASPITCAVDGVAQTIWKTEGDGDPTLKDIVVGRANSTEEELSVLYRRAGWFGSWPFPILLSYTGGLDPIPGDLVEACLLVMQTMQKHEKALTEVQALGTGVVSGSVTYRPDSLVPMYSKQLLDRYRVVPV